MKLALHQPYFFPYIGYFVIVNGVDIYVHSDTMQYMRHGWVNRNRILVGEEEWKYIVVPIRKPKTSDKINEIQIDYSKNWEEKIIAQLSYYKKCAPYYENVIGILEKVFSKKYNNLADLNIASTNEILKYLNIEKRIYRLSDMSLQMKEKPEPDEWGILVSCTFDDVDCYWNAPGGKEFYNKQKYYDRDLDIKFVEPELKPYKQGRNKKFIEGLSIIDVMMFNSVDTIREMLLDYRFL